jgi:hypothetical protein
VSRAEELGYLRWKYAAVSDPRAKAAIAEYADAVYGPVWRAVPEQPPDELGAVIGFARRGEGGHGDYSGRRPEHARLLRHMDALNTTLRRIR